jgi:hypothetical protein
MWGQPPSAVRRAKLDSGFVRCTDAQPTGEAAKNKSREAAKEYSPRRKPWGSTAEKTKPRSGERNEASLGMKV